MALKPGSIRSAKFGKRFFCKNSWRRCRQTAKHDANRMRRQADKAECQQKTPRLAIRGWAD